VNLPPNRAAWPARYREFFEERAAIIEFMGNLSRQTAEFRAEQDIRKLAATEKRQERTA
jgi:hypothetical protein